MIWLREERGAGTRWRGGLPGPLEGPETVPCWRKLRLMLAGSYGRPALIHSCTRLSPIRRALGSLAHFRNRSFSLLSS